MTKAEVIEQARPLIGKAKWMLMKELAGGLISVDEFDAAIFKVDTLTRNFPIAGKEKSYTVLKKRQHAIAQWILEYTSGK